MKARGSVAKTLRLALSGLALGWFAASGAWGQVAGNGARALVTAPVDAARQVQLPGNHRPEAIAANERGLVEDSLALDHLQLLLRRPAEREQALKVYIRDLHDRNSTVFHHWLTPAQLARDYGPAQGDIDAVTAWLQAQGFTINAVSAAGLVIDFSGTAGVVRTAFHTEIHHLTVAGAAHIANMSDPQVPAALAPVIVGVVSLHDFRPQPLHSARRLQAPPAARQVVKANGVQLVGSNGYQLVSPADLALIYGLNPSFSSGVTGQGQTIALVEPSNAYSLGDWSTFRSTLGLSSYTSGSLTQVHPKPAGGSSCPNPGVVKADEDEVILDAEWASAAAPGASIELASCGNSATTSGLVLALQNLVNASTPPNIISVSYGECEAGNGAAGNAAYASVYQQAVAEGISVFVAAGDGGAAVCDEGNSATTATHGIAVSGIASTPYNVAVGGTDFGDRVAGTSSSYWSSSNSTNYLSALSYVPEIPWNNSCAGALLANYAGYASGYGASGFCASSTGANYINIVAGSGGPSGCASGTPSSSEVVGGSCAGYAKPTYQQLSVPGLVADGVRDLPDVSLFAGNGLWGHYYVYCWSDTSNGGAACGSNPAAWSGAGGTSFAAPILAGIQALVNQSVGGSQGNPDYVYYPLAASQAAAGLACNSSSGTAEASACVFHDVTRGDMAVNCQGSSNCYLPSGSYGALSTSSSAYAAAYATTTGWDFATGLGSVNVANLIAAWSTADLALSGTGQVTSSGLLDYTLTVANSGPQAATAVTVSVTLPAGMSLASGSSSGCAQSGQVVTCAVGSLAVNGSAALVVMVQPGTAASASVTFSVASAAGDIDSANNQLLLVNSGLPNAASPDSDGPLPPWSLAVLGALLLGVALRGARAGGGAGDDRAA